MENEDIEKAKQHKKQEVEKAAANAVLDNLFSDAEKDAFYCYRRSGKIRLGFDRDDGTVIEIALSTAWTSEWMKSLGDIVQKVKAGASFDELQTFDSAATRIKAVYLYSAQNNVLKKCDRRIRKIRISEGIKELHAHAFAYCTSLKSVFIPKSVEKISARSFYKCEALKTLSVDAENPYFCSVASTLYTKDRLSLIFNPPCAKPTIVNGVKRIAENAFAYNLNLSEIEIPESVEIIDRNAFNACWFLKKIVLKGKKTEVDKLAFGFEYGYPRDNVEIVRVQD